MPHIPQLDLADATTEQRAAHNEEMRLRGRMTNMKRTLLHSPAALRIYGEWFTLRDELAPIVGDRVVLIMCLAISRQMQSPVGMAFMRRGLASLTQSDAPAPVDLADIEAFGTAFAADPRSIPTELWQRLSTRLSPKTLVDLTALAGIMIATNAFMSAVGTEIDEGLEPYLDDDTD